MITKTFKLAVIADTEEQMQKEEERLSMIYGVEEIEGVTFAYDILDKIQAEIEQDAFKDVNGSKYIFVNRINRIFDKYRPESEDKE